MINIKILVFLTSFFLLPDAFSNRFKSAAKQVQKLNSFSNVGRLNRVRREVFSIPINGKLPDSIIRNYDSREIAEGIVYRVNYKCNNYYFNKKNIDREDKSLKEHYENVENQIPRRVKRTLKKKSRFQKFKDYFKNIFNKVDQEKELEKKFRKDAELNKSDFDFRRDNSKLAMAFRDTLIDKIMENGFLNVFQTGKGTFGSDRSYLTSRVKTLKQITCLDIGYGQGIQSKVNQIRPKFAFLVVEDPILSEKFKTNPSYGNVFAVFKNDTKRRATFTIGDSFAAILFSGANPQAKNRAFSFDYPTIKRLQGLLKYYEAQIFGDLTINDVAYFMVPKDIERNALNRVKTAGLPIYSFEKSVMEKGKLIFKGR